jgi:hypothetical protein
MVSLPSIVAIFPHNHCDSLLSVIDLLLTDIILNAMIVFTLNFRNGAITCQSHATALIPEC